ncbi:MAG: VWA domain-containing protein [Phycisphaerae bacterium]|nr:VWA domain-containing protein [Phycisphaerae bacterium]
MTRKTTTTALAAVATAVLGCLNIAQAQSAKPAASAAPALAAPAKARPVAAPRTPKVQIAILLDHSGSMSGLINQARSELWTIVNEFATAKYQGQRPILEVALYGYGSPPGQQLAPLTTDLDLVSQQLFGLGGGGGSEYCGQIIEKATKELKWSTSNDDLKLIFIAGNEAFTQGPVDFKTACAQAISKGIIVNTIHCGDEGTGVNGKWRDGAMLADGKFLNINQNAAVAHIEAPQDKRLAELGVEMNTTFIPFGAHGATGAENQARQDANAGGVSTQVAVQRAVTKGSVNYRNDSWCLADAVKTKKVDLAKVKVEDLPENMRKMTVEQRRAYVAEKLKQRTGIQKQIADLNTQRKQYVAAKRKELATKGEETLNTAVVKAVRDQAAKKNFVLEDATAAAGN